MKLSPTWQSPDFTSVMKLMDMMGEYDWNRTAEKALWEALLMMDDLLPAETVRLGNEMMDGMMDDEKMMLEPAKKAMQQVSLNFSTTLY